MNDSELRELACSILTRAGMGEGDMDAPEVDAAMDILRAGGDEAEAVKAARGVVAAAEGRGCDAVLGHKEDPNLHRCMFRKGHVGDHECRTCHQKWPNKILTRAALAAAEGREGNGLNQGGKDPQKGRER